MIEAILSDFQRGRLAGVTLQCSGKTKFILITVQNYNIKWQKVTAIF